MDNSEKMAELKVIIGEEEESAVLLSYLDQAKSAILNRMYPYGTDEELDGMDVPARFEMKQIRIAAYLLNKRGAEGQRSHEENGIRRGYSSSDVPVELVQDIMPVVGIPR